MSACTRTYRMVVLRKNRSIEFPKVSSVCLTTSFTSSTFFQQAGPLRPRRFVWESNDRMSFSREPKSRSLKSGVHALETPLDNLESNWAYMVMATLAWNL